MRQFLARVLALVALLCGGDRAVRSAPVHQLAPPTELDAQVRALTPISMLSFATSTSFQVHYLAADLDSSGEYAYIIATYDAPSYGMKIRVLRNVDGELVLAGTLNGSDGSDYADGARAELVYLDDTGVPAVEVDSWGASYRHRGVDLLKWTGTGLVSMLPSTATLVDAYFADPTGTGVPELINPPYCDRGACEGYFQVFDLKNGVYSLVATSTVDPTGPVSQSIDKVIVAPAGFNAADLLAAPTMSLVDGEVMVELGNLERTSGQSTETDVSEIDPGSIYLGRNIKPIRVEIVAPKSDERAGFDGSFVLVTVSRSSVLQYLGKAQVSKAPAPGDVLSLPVHARLKNGVALYGFASISIVGQSGK